MPGLVSTIREMTPRARLVTAGLLALAVVCYAYWLTNGSFHFWSHRKGFGLTFNSMLDHLLRGEFDVDPATVRDEGFARNGRVFAYWGVFLAVIRLPLTLYPGWLGIDVTRLSCVLAVCVAACVKLLTLQLVFQSSPSSVCRGVLRWALTATILFAGPQTEFLCSTVYQEVCLWAGALSAVFVYFAIRGLVHGRFTASSLCAMACAAGLALLTRVSTGIGLYAALGLLLLVMLLREPSQDGVPRPPASAAARFAAHLVSVRFLSPLILLLGFAALAGLVNYRRWGNPLVFADYHYYLLNPIFPDQLPRMEAYGLFNLVRAPFGLVYYFFPIWILLRPDGHLLFEEQQWRLLHGAELPPSSFLLTDPLLLLLLLYAARALLGPRRGGGVDRSHALALALGLAVPCVLMLSAISMSFRYRIEFYPLLELGAFLGFLLLCRQPPAPAASRRIRTLAVALAGIGILGSHAMMILYRISDPGSSIAQMRRGVITYYMEQSQSHWPWVASVPQ
jgi:hypothetical protein